VHFNEIFFSHVDVSIRSGMGANPSKDTGKARGKWGRCWLHTWKLKCQYHCGYHRVETASQSKPLFE
jgi:hypothetical protein